MPDRARARSSQLHNKGSAMHKLIQCHAAALTLALVAGAAGAQSLTQAPKAPEPPVMSDVAPLPPHDRSSVGAVLMREEPVLAKRAYLEQLARDGRSEGPDTSVLGGSPSPTPVDAPAQKPKQKPRKQN
jgi:hypothetical protein